MNTVIRMPRRAASVDSEAVAIGMLYQKGFTAFLEVGKKLIAKQNSLAHGEWGIWLDNNAATLGFSESTARRFMKFARQYPASDARFDALEITAINRQLWGNTHRTNRALPSAAVRENAPTPTAFDQQLERLRRAWAAAGADARKEFLHLVLEQIG
jgi:hypothetical protein